MNSVQEDIAKEGELATRVVVWPDDPTGSLLWSGVPGFALREENKVGHVLIFRLASLFLLLSVPHS